MKINRTLEQHRQYMNQFFDKVTVQNILICFLAVVMILGFSLAGAHAETHADGTEPDNDMGKELRPIIYNYNPIEFNINAVSSV